MDQSQPPSDRRFNFTCSMCGSVLEALLSQCGSSGRCPTCAAVFVIPQVGRRAESAVVESGGGVVLPDPTPVHAYAAAGAKAPDIERLADGTCRIVCPRCSSKSGMESDFCPRCGFPFTMEGANRAAGGAGSGLAVTAFMVALICLPLTFCTHIGALGSFIAAVLAWSDLNRRSIAGSPRGGRGLARAGLVLAAAGLAIAMVRIALGA